MGGAQEPQAPERLGKETAWAIPSRERATTPRYRFILTSQGKRQVRIEAIIMEYPKVRLKPNFAAIHAAGT